MWLIARTPFEVQLEALRRGGDRDGYGFFMEQGLGKSATTLANFELLRSKGAVRKLLIISPNSFKGDWLEELEKARIAVPGVVYTPDRAAAFLHHVRNHKEWVAVINYESVAKFAEQYVKDVTGPDVMIVADESIKLKSYKTIQSRASRFLAEHCGIRRVLSGKSVTQGPHDLWAQLRFIGQEQRRNYFGFRNRYCQMGGYLGKQVVGAANVVELNAYLNRHAFMARKKDWSDLPEKLPPTTISVGMQGKQKAIYKEMEQQLATELQSGQVRVEQIITRDIKLRQILSGWLYDEFGNFESLIPFTENPRYKALRDVLEGLSGKAVIVAWYKPTINFLLEHLSDLKPAYIRGGMTPEDIKGQKRRFNEEDDCEVIVVQQVSAKYGHTLLGTQDNPCSTMIFFEQSYSLDDRSQIEDRIHRFGQVWPCSYVDFVSSVGKLDRAIIRALQRKESVAAAVLGYATGQPETVG